MAQVGHIRQSEASIASSDTLHVQINIGTDPMQTEDTSESQVYMGSTVEQIAFSPMEGVSTESPAAEDDDVQIIFSAPRRRKKRRRKIGSTLSASPLSQVCKASADDLTSLKIHHVVPQEAPRRRSISVVQRLELCKLGEEISPTCRAGSLPAMPCATSSSIADIQSPWFADSSYDGGSSSSQFPPLTDYAAWWDQSLPTLQPRPLPSIQWRSLQLEDSDLKKRKLDASFDESPIPPCQLCDSLQVSPRATPVSVVMSPSSSPCPSYAKSCDVYGPYQDLPSSMVRSNSECNGRESAGHERRGPSSISHSSVPVDLSNHHPTVSKISPLHQTPLSNRVENRGGGEPLHQYADQAILAAPSNQTHISIQLHRPSNDKDHQTQHLRTMPLHSRLHTLPPLSSTLGHMNSPQLPTPLTDTRPRIRSDAQPSAPIGPPRGGFRVAQSSDILRKPSLYSIPRWPSPSKLAATPVQSAIVQSHTRHELPRNTEVVHARTTHGGLRHPSSASRSSRIEAETRTQSAGIRPAKVATQHSSPAPDYISPNVTNFQIPKARLTHKHSPNLVVDIAETCQELFPFAEVAKRHEIPIQRVYDTFSAIIQLPLLRNADDRRRHGSLGKRRMKEFRDANRAMEKAQEAEKKAQRVRMEDSSRKGIDQGRTRVLLKSAVLNNVREVYRVD